MNYNVLIFKAIGVEVFKNKRICFLMIFQEKLSSFSVDTKMSKESMRCH